MRQLNPTIAQLKLITRNGTAVDFFILIDISSEWQSRERGVSCATSQLDEGKNLWQKEIHPSPLF